jgi:hypothetical protein
MDMEGSAKGLLSCSSSRPQNNSVNSLSIDGVPAEIHTPDISRSQVRYFTYLEQNSSALKTICLHHQKLTLSPKYLSLFLMYIAESLHSVSMKSEDSMQISGCSMLLVPVHGSGVDLTLLKTH